MCCFSQEQNRKGASPFSLIDQKKKCSFRIINYAERIENRVCYKLTSFIIDHASQHHPGEVDIMRKSEKMVEVKQALFSNLCQ